MHPNMPNPPGLQVPWSDFRSCDAERAYCADHPNTLQLHCRQTCNTCAASSCFVPIAATPTQTPVARTSGDPALFLQWREVYTFNGNTALDSSSSSTVKVYLKLVDAADSSMVGYHEMATLTRLAARRRRRRQAAGDAAAPRTAGMTISIDENGRLTAAMEFPDGAVVSVDVDTDTAGGSTRAPDSDGGDTAGQGQDAHQLPVGAIRSR